MSDTSRKFNKLTASRHHAGSTKKYEVTQHEMRYPLTTVRLNSFGFALSRCLVEK